MIPSSVPDVTVPAGLAGPLPVGISFTGARWSDARMRAFAADFERVALARVPPRYLPTLPS